MTTKIFSERLKKARMDKGLTQRELATRVGLSDKSISIYENGKAYPPISNLLMIAKELEKDISYFLSS